MIQEMKCLQWLCKENKTTSVILVFCFNTDEQVRMKSEIKAREKQRLIMDDQKKMAENVVSPWGKAGAGAPQAFSDGSFAGRRMV